MAILSIIWQKSLLIKVSRLSCNVGFNCSQKYDILKRNKLSNSHIVTGLLLLNGNYWTLLWADLSTQVIYYLDPNSDSIDKSIDVLNTWSAFLNMRKEFEHVNKTWQLGKFSRDYQNDSNNCGIICLLFFENLIKNIFCSYFNTEILNENRKQLFEFMKLHSKNHSDFCCKCGQYDRKELKDSRLVKCSLGCSRLCHFECIDREIFTCSFC